MGGARPKGPLTAARGLSRPSARPPAVDLDLGVVEDALDGHRGLADAHDDALDRVALQDGVRQVVCERLYEVEPVGLHGRLDQVVDALVVDGGLEVVAPAGLAEVEVEVDVHEEPLAVALLARGDAVEGVEGHVAEGDAVAGHAHTGDWRARPGRKGFARPRGR